MANKTLVNFWGGPGSGKSTWAMHTAALLKHGGRLAEYVPEFAKGWAWDGGGRFEERLAPYEIIGRQLGAISRPKHACDFIITDCSPLMSSFYTEDTPRFAKMRKMVWDLHFEQLYGFDRIIDIFVNREGHEFKQYGRIHDEAAGRRLDVQFFDRYIRGERPVEKGVVGKVRPNVFYYQTLYLYGGDSIKVLVEELAN